MLKPLTHMALVLISFTFCVHAQSSEDNTNSLLCLIGRNSSPQEFNLNLSQKQPVTIACSYEDASVTIPKYLQFSCEGGNSLITVQILISDGDKRQTVVKDISVNDRNVYYEMPLLAYVTDDMAHNPKAKIYSVTFSNNMNTEHTIGEVGFSRYTSRYEVKLNQVFTVDIGTGSNKRYVIQSNVPRDIFVNMYRSNGEFDHKILQSIKTGENAIQFEEMQIKSGKYVVVISDVADKKTPSSKITVMY
ncbi:MAG: hypothetical protein IPM95_12620 [Sphingobacteriales bacterium]|jgi:hypothetical protein|nr:hypothetical protein [Sphingobacteriales bacterium]